MAQHGYLHDEYDRDFGGSDDRDDNWRERAEREWRGQDRDWQDRDRGWQGQGQNRQGPDRGRGDFMLGDRDRGQDRGFFNRLGERARDAFSDDDRDHRRQGGSWENNGDWPQSRSGGQRSAGGNQWSQSGQRATNHPDDHYRSWRDKQMQSLDRDYQDYCREREQQFHSDFDSWRQNRHRQGLRVGTGLEQGSGADEQTFTPQTTAVGNTMTTSETHEPQSTTEPEDTATLGTTLGRKR
jgi:hypothetical protein